MTTPNERDRMPKGETTWSPPSQNFTRLTGPRPGRKQVECKKGAGPTWRRLWATDSVTSRPHGSSTPSGKASSRLPLRSSSVNAAAAAQHARVTSPARPPQPACCVLHSGSAGSALGCSSDQHDILPDFRNNRTALAVDLCCAFYKSTNVYAAMAEGGEELHGPTHRQGRWGG